jgi:hypothetical protein
MKFKQSALVASVTTAAITLSENGFLPGQKVIARLQNPTGTAFAGTAAIQTLVGSTWTSQNLVDGNSTISALPAGACWSQEIMVEDGIRLNVTARSAGSILLSIESDV